MQRKDLWVGTVKEIKFVVEKNNDGNDTKIFTIHLKSGECHMTLNEIAGTFSPGDHIGLDNWGCFWRKL